MKKKNDATRESNCFVVIVIKSVMKAGQILSINTGWGNKRLDKKIKGFWKNKAIKTKGR